MNPQQRQRLDKVGVDEFFFLGASRNDEDDSYQIDVSGSTKNLYHVFIDADWASRCDCPDGKTRAPDLGVVCKHVCFVMTRVLRLRFDDVLAAGLRIPVDRRATVAGRLDGLALGNAGVDPGVTDPVLQQRYRAFVAAAGGAAPVEVKVEAGVAVSAGAGTGSAGAGTGSAGTGSVGAGAETEEDAWKAALTRLQALKADEDICLVCFEDLVSAQPATRASAEKLWSCSKCRGLVHRMCQAKWVAMGRRVCTCCNGDWRAVPLGPRPPEPPAPPAPPTREPEPATAGRKRGRAAPKPKPNPDYANFA